MRKVKGGCVCDDDGSHGKKVIGAAVIITVTVVWKKSDSINEDEVRQSKCNIFPCNGRCCWRGQGWVILFMIMVIMALLLLAVVMAGLLAKTVGTKLIIFYCSCVCMVMVVILAPMMARW